MSQSYLVQERWARLGDELDPILVVSDDCAEIVKIIRVLSGTARVAVVNEDGEEYFFSSINFLNPEQSIEQNEIDSILSYIFEDIPNRDEVSHLISSIKYQNLEFYKGIREEICLLIIAFETGRMVESFLYLYRILERMSVATPLIYAAREPNFYKAHEFLTSLLDADKTSGDLGVLRNFLQLLALGHENFREGKIEFNLSSLPNWFSIECIKQIRSLGAEVKGIQFDEDASLITVPFKDISSFIVFIRNKSFHNQASRKNFNFIKLGGAERFLSIFVPKLIYWFSYIFIEFAKWQLDRVPR